MGLLTPQEIAALEPGERLVVIDPSTSEGEKHVLFEGGEVVEVVLPHDVASNGDIKVRTVMIADDEPFEAYIPMENIATEEAVMAQLHEEHDEEIRQFSYIPHPEYPNLPTYDTLPLGYALGVVAHIKNLGQPVPPVTMFFPPGGFPTA